MAETVSLAVLENLVHMSRQDLPAGYVIVAAVIPDHVRVLRVEEIASEPGPVDERALGDRWFDSGASAVLEVRSRVVPIEHSYLLNPEHPDFAENHG